MMESAPAFDDIAALTGGRLGRCDVPCPVCEPDRRHQHNRKRKVLRIWHYDPDFIRYHCARCGASGYVRADGEQEIDPQKLAQFRARADEERRREEARKAAGTRKALKLWNEAVPGQGTIMERYFISRGLDRALAFLFRFHPHCPHPNGATLPAMIALVEHVEQVAIHRTFLAADGSGKAPIEPNKAALGPIGRGAVRLAKASHVLGLTEGIETAISVLQLTGIPCWACLGAGRMQSVEIPACVRELHVFADDDKAGHDAAERVIDLHTSLGRRVVKRLPPAGVDDYAGIAEALKQREQRYHERSE
jgi:putative DNA primase/helicase